MVRKKIITLKIDEDVLIELDDIAEIMGKSRSELVREAIDKYLRELKKSEDFKEVLKEFKERWTRIVLGEEQ